MAHGINNQRCFVYANSQDKDWHKLTQHREGLDPMKHFPEFQSVPLFYSYNGAQFNPSRHVLISTDDGLPCGEPFNMGTRTNILPQVSYGMVQDALAGTRYTVERIGMLWDRSFWFVSVSLDELKSVARKGESFQLNFSGGLDGKDVLQGELSSTRAVCHNTITISRISGDVLFRVKQTLNALTRLNNAKADVEKAVGMARVFNETMQSIESKPATVEQARAIYAAEIIQAGGDVSLRALKSGEMTRGKAGNTIDSLVSAFQHGDGNRGETRADVLNGFTQVFTRGGLNTTKDAWKALESSEFGGNANRKAKFFSIVTDDNAWNQAIEIGNAALAN